MSQSQHKTKTHQRHLDCSMLGKTAQAHAGKVSDILLFPSPASQEPPGYREYPDFIHSGFPGFHQHPRQEDVFHFNVCCIDTSQYHSGIDCRGVPPALHVGKSCCFCFRCLLLRRTLWPCHHAIRSLHSQKCLAPTSQQRGKFSFNSSL